MTRPVGLMDYCLFEKIIDEIPLHANEILCIHGIGDSLLHPELKKFISYANKRGFKTTTSTNPSSLNSKTIKAILDSGLGHLTISLDGVDEKTYRYLRGKAANYERAIESIHMFLAEKKRGGYKDPKVEMSIIKMNKTEAGIEEFKKIWNIEGVDHIAIKEFTTWDGSAKTISEMSLDDKNNGFHQFACIRPWLTISVLWNGLVVPCCYDYDGKFVLGDLNSHSILEVWNGEKAKRLRKSLMEGDFKNNQLCGNCQEADGAMASKLYPLNMLTVLRNLGTKRIIKFLKKEGNVYIGDK